MSHCSVQSALGPEDVEVKLHRGFVNNTSMVCVRFHSLFIGLTRIQPVQTPVAGGLIPGRLPQLPARSANFLLLPLHMFDPARCEPWRWGLCWLNASCYRRQLNAHHPEPQPTFSGEVVSYLWREPDENTSRFLVSGFLVIGTNTRADVTCEDYKIAVLF